MEILYKDDNCIVIYKPALMPSQPDPTGDPDALTLSMRALSELGERSELYPIHRLDRVVGGLLAFARNKRSAAALSELVSTDGIGKEYLAVTDAPLAGGEYTDLIYKDAKQKKSFIVDRMRSGVKEARLTLTPIAEAEHNGRTKMLSRVILSTGRFHQIRAQLSHRAAPITGDKKYGSRDPMAKEPALFATHLSFSLFGKIIDVRRNPDTASYPWSLFSSDIEGDGHK